MMHGREKSDFAIVAGKPTNKAVPTAAEPVERRAGAKGNASQQSTHRTQRRVRVSQALERVHSGVSKLPGPHKIRNCRRIANRVLISTTPTGESELSTSPNLPPTLIFARDSRAPWRPHEALACICASGKALHEGRERARTGGMNLQRSAQMS